MPRRTYPIQGRVRYAPIYQRPVYHRKKPMSLAKKAGIVIGCFIILSLLFGATIYYNIGPQNMLSAWYNQVRNPTYDEMVKFIHEDLTDENEYTSTYRCGEFTKDVITNAKKEGYLAGFVTITSDDSYHACVAFQTTDLGLYFLEPQSDVIFAQSQMDFMLQTNRYYLKGHTGFIDLPMYDYKINWWSSAIDL